MKKLLAAVLVILCMLAAGCTGGEKAKVDSAPVEASASIEESTSVEETAAALETVSVDNQVAVKEPTLTDDGLFRSDFMGLSFSLPEGWYALDRKTIASELGYTEDYADAKPDKVLPYHIPYVEMWAKDDIENSIQLMIDNPPLQKSDSVSLNTPAEYMDYERDYYPELHKSYGIEITESKRDKVSFLGYDFERYSFTAQDENSAYYSVIMVTEKDGYFYTIYVTTFFENNTQDLLDLLKAE